MNELPEGLGRFSCGDLSFEVDDGYSLVPLASGAEIDEQSLDRRLSESKRVPKDAPLASWILARLARLARGSLAIDEGTVEICAGGLYVIDFVIRRSADPVGKVQLQAGVLGAALLGVVSREVDPAEVVERFIEALLVEPAQVSPCRARARDPAWPEDRVIEYGFDGSSYL